VRARREDRGGGGGGGEATRVWEGRTRERQAKPRRGGVRERQGGGCARRIREDVVRGPRRGGSRRAGKGGKGVGEATKGGQGKATEGGRGGVGQR
jgi:hypothetical protein